MPACEQDKITGTLTLRKIREFGRSREAARFNGEYNRRLIHRETDAIKQPQRERIAEHLLRHHPQGRRFRLLSMPGLTWPFEWMIHDELNGRCEFNGLEWNWGTIELGMAHMPGGYKRRLRYDFKIGELLGIKSSVARWLYCWGGDFLGLRAKDLKKGEFGWKEFRERFRRHTCAWLDMNTNVSEEFRKCASGIAYAIAPSIKVAPVAFTFIAGQEHGELADGVGSIERRLPLLQAFVNDNHLRRVLEITDAWQYDSGFGCHMVNAVGLLKYKV